MPNPFDILRRAQDSQPLGAAERAFVKMVKSIEPAVLTGVATALSDMVLVQHQYDVRALAFGGLSAAAVVCYRGLAKYLSASTDPAAKVVGEALTAEESAVEQALGYNDPKTPAAPDATPAPAPMPAPTPEPAPAPLA